MKIRQFDFELTSNGLIFVKEMVYFNAHNSGPALGIYGLTRSVLTFDDKWTLKIKLKYRYNNTDSAVMD